MIQNHSDVAIDQLIYFACLAPLGGGVYLGMSHARINVGHTQEEGARKLHEHRSMNHRKQGILEKRWFPHVTINLKSFESSSA
mmetsp:Transcript_35343/g.87951  ORF Transcript_35343/g.87951 Transcript_35343/m.87951 type:complete len:83 (+) Transcript_35343:844-1092(+)